MKQQKIISVVGGTGFLGRYVVRQLARRGYPIQVISRHPERVLQLKPSGDVGQIVPVAGDIKDIGSLHDTLERSYAVINLAGILYEKGKQNFTAIHAQGAEKLAQAAASLGVTKFIHISALGVDKVSGSNYARTKALGEKAVLAAFPTACILRPSVLFGPEDDFFNQFAHMAGFSPALPLIGGGRTRFQPVYVADVAKAVAICLQKPQTNGQTYELGGPQIFTFKEVLEYVLRVTHKNRKLVNIPFGMATGMGTLGELLPVPPLTRDQVRLLEHDNVVSPNAKGFSALGISATSVDMIVPGYLERFKNRQAA
ncbi:MAG: complex I NDUFA9 subunit family protein [Alphaproteobacteria bacterium]